MERKKRRQEYYMKRQILSEVGEDATAQDVLDYLMGDEDGNYSNYTVYKYRDDNRTVMNRLNMIWVFPLFLISLPFQWLFTGNMGVSRNTKIGKAVDYLVKLD